MRLLNPAGLLGLLLAVPIVLLYMLRLHRKNAPVPSLLLWEAVLADRHANRPWQKLRRNWLLSHRAARLAWQSRPLKYLKRKVKAYAW